MRFKCRKHRIDRLREGISKLHDVLEIGPFHVPIAPRSLGYRTTIVDISLTNDLRSRAEADPNITADGVAAIEEVDLIGSACDIGDLCRERFGTDRLFDWVVSSHNIDHLPNPIRFFQQAASVLKPGGTLRLAVPDKRACFDHFRSLSDTSEWLRAFHENRSQPTAYQRFQAESASAVLVRNGKQRFAWRLGDVVSAELQVVSDVRGLFSSLFGQDGTISSEYVDTHCWAFTPESFELITRDLIAFDMKTNNLTYSYW